MVEKKREIKKTRLYGRARIAKICSIASYTAVLAFSATRTADKD
jgi:hypothetical protein